MDGDSITTKVEKNMQVALLMTKFMAMEGTTSSQEQITKVTGAVE